MTCAHIPKAFNRNNRHFSHVRDVWQTMGEGLCHMNRNPTHTQTHIHKLTRANINQNTHHINVIESMHFTIWVGASERCTDARTIHHERLPTRNHSVRTTGLRIIFNYFWLHWCVCDSCSIAGWIAFSFSFWIKMQREWKVLVESFLLFSSLTMIMFVCVFFSLLIFSLLWCNESLHCVLFDN